jgi:hypothetical protein
MRDVGTQQTAEEGERHQPRRDEGGPPCGLADAGPGHGHEQEGQQRARVDRGQLEALERSRLAPPTDRAGEDDHEEDEVEQGSERGGDGGQVRVAADQEQIARAVVATELVGTGEEQRGHEGQREDQITGNGQHAILRRSQTARREAQAQVQEHAAP